MNTKLTELINQTAQESFVQGYLDASNLETVQAEAFGIMVSKWARWDVDLIVKVCVSALEDCNAHSLATLLEDANTSHEG